MGMMGNWRKLLRTHKRRSSDTNAGYDWDSVIACPANGSDNEDDNAFEQDKEAAGSSDKRKNGFRKSSHKNDDGNKSVEKASPEELSQDVRDYFYLNMDKDEATGALQRCLFGTYLLRSSACSDAQFTLSVRGDRQVFNVRIFFCSNRSGYHLDAPKNLRKYFPSVTELLSYYSQESKELIALYAGENNNSGGGEKSAFKLLSPLRKSSPQNLAIVGPAAGAEGAEGPAAAGAGADRPVTRGGGSLKAMVKWL